MLIPIFSAVLELLTEEARLELYELLEKISPNLKIIAFTIKILQCLVKRPLVFFYEVGCDDSEGTRLSPH
jgi:hypothetical protein